MLHSLLERIERARRALGRATLVPVLVRCGIGVALVLAMAVAWPSQIVASRLALPLLLLALWPALAPRGRGATVAILVAVFGWIADTTWFDARVALWRVVGLAALVYIGHTLAALAAAMPYDALVNLDVVTGWIVRALAVVLVSSVLTVTALALASVLAGGPFVAATLLGLAGAVGATMLLSRLLRRA